MEMVGLFALTALLLAGLGIYGCHFLYRDRARTHEIGIRIALGAETQQHPCRWSCARGLGLAIAGATVGLVGALIVSHLMAGLLYGRQADRSSHLCDRRGSSHRCRFAPLLIFRPRRAPTGRSANRAET